MSHDNSKIVALMRKGESDSVMNSHAVILHSNTGLVFIYFDIHTLNNADMTPFITRKIDYSTSVIGIAGVHKDSPPLAY